MTNDLTEVLVTGIDWMGGGISSIESAMEHLFQNAQDEILLTVYSISSRADLLFELLNTVLSRGVKTKIVINRFEKQPHIVKEQLIVMAKKYPHFILHKFIINEESDLHAKVIVADRKEAIVGSSNLSWRGMVTNYELALRVKGEMVINIAHAVDRLLKSNHVVKIDLES